MSQCRYKAIRAGFITTRLIILIMSFVEVVLYFNTGLFLEHIKQINPCIDAHMAMRFIIVTALAFDILANTGWILASLRHRRWWLFTYGILGSLAIPAAIHTADETSMQFNLVRSIPLLFSVIFAFSQSIMIGRKLHLSKETNVNVGAYYPAPSFKDQKAIVDV